MIETEVLQKAINQYGADAQMRMAQEELAELIVAISHQIRGRARLQDIVSEIADVTICLEQLKMIIGCREQVFLEEIEFKLKRLESRLDGKELS